MGGLMEQMRFEKNQNTTQHIQIQIDKPKSKEIPMKSKTRHIDGGGGNTHVHRKIRRTNGI